MKTSFYFVRHAQPNYNNHDDLTRELTEKGMRDRRLVTAFLETREIGAVLSSPYKRAVDTVKEFADRHKLGVALIEDFRERRVGSGWIEDFTAFTKMQWADFDYKLPGGESLREVQARNIAALMSALGAYPGKNIAVGSHGTALCTIISYYEPSFGYEGFDSVKSLMPWVVRFEFDFNTCVNIEKIDLFNQ
jgi:2,3-bisphosphoglycerate-dependent phosphoglycerate mutase